MSAVTDDQTFNDPHEAIDALVEAFGELRSAAGLSEQSSEPIWWLSTRCADPTRYYAARTASSAE
jgi:hypothetical protein